MFFKSNIPSLPTNPFTTQTKADNKHRVGYLIAEQTPAPQPPTQTTPTTTTSTPRRSNAGRDTLISGGIPAPGSAAVGSKGRKLAEKNLESFVLRTFKEILRERKRKNQSKFLKNSVFPRKEEEENPQRGLFTKSSYYAFFSLFLFSFFLFFFILFLRSFIFFF